MRHVLSDIWSGLWGPDGDECYGQSLIDDVRSAWQFRQLRQKGLIWLQPEAYAGNATVDFPVLDRFGDGILAWRHEGIEQWFVIERLWHGWPDPPQHALLVFGAGGHIRIGKDFQDWPTAWKIE